MRSIIRTLLLIGIFSFSSVAWAHEPGAQVVSSNGRRYVFYLAGIVFIGALINRIGSLLSLSSSTKSLISWIIIGIGMGVSGYFIYHRFIE